MISGKIKCTKTLLKTSFWSIFFFIAKGLKLLKDSVCVLHYYRIYHLMRFANNTHLSGFTPKMHSIVINKMFIKRLKFLKSPKWLTSQHPDGHPWYFKQKLEMWNLFTSYTWHWIIHIIHSTVYSYRFNRKMRHILSTSLKILLNPECSPMIFNYSHKQNRSY